MEKTKRVFHLEGYSRTNEFGHNVINGEVRELEYNCRVVLYRLLTIYRNEDAEYYGSILGYKVSDSFRTKKGQEEISVIDVIPFSRFSDDKRKIEDIFEKEICVPFSSL